MKRAILITGSTDGIGKLAAIKLAKEGHEIYLHGRSPEKLSTAISAVKEQSKNEKIKGFIADFSDLDAVKRVAQQINEEVPRMDVLINNAGVFKSAVPHNGAGLDIRFVVNYFAPYILTKELLPLLEKGTGSRIINLSSAAQSSISYEALSGKGRLSEREAYAQSKLALTVWSFHLSKTLEDISVMAVNPGSLLNTKMVKEAFGNHWSTADKGADILYDLAVLEAYEGVTGEYFDNDKGTLGKAHEDAYDEAKTDELMVMTTDVLADWL